MRRADGWGPGTGGGETSTLGRERGDFQSKMERTGVATGELRGSVDGEKVLSERWLCQN